MRESNPSPKSGVDVAVLRMWKTFSSEVTVGYVSAACYYFPQLPLFPFLFSLSFVYFSFLLYLQISFLAPFFVFQYFFLHLFFFYLTFIFLYFISIVFILSFILLSAHSLFLPHWYDGRKNERTQKELLVHTSAKCIRYEQNILTESHVTVVSIPTLISARRLTHLNETCNYFPLFLQ